MNLKLHVKVTHESYTWKLHVKVTRESYTWKLHMKVTHESYTWKLHMKEIKKILAKTHFKCKYKNLLMLRNGTLSWKHVSLQLFFMPLLLPHICRGSIHCTFTSSSYSQRKKPSPCYLRVWYNHELNDPPLNMIRAQHT